MSDPVRRHYELYPYPHYPLLASVRRCDTYALNLTALWTRFNGALPPPEARRILIAGCGSFSPYPFALANPDSTVTAVDLSARSLRRARLHCLLHGLWRPHFLAGDLLDPQIAPGSYGFIDAYGVLHHLPDPLAGLQALAKRLCRGGIVRLMVYSRYTRQEEESVRRALRLLGVRDPATARALLKRAPKGSRLNRFLESSGEVADSSGLADALLHPCVTTYRIAPLMELVRRCGMEPLLFAHKNALPEVDREVERIAALETRKESPGNFVLFLGKGVAGRSPDEDDARFMLNPMLEEAVAPWRMGTVRVAPRLGVGNRPLDRGERHFLRRFKTAVRAGELTTAERALALEHAERLFLLHYRAGDIAAQGR